MKNNTNKKCGNDKRREENITNQERSNKKINNSMR